MMRLRFAAMALVAALPFVSRSEAQVVVSRGTPAGGLIVSPVPPGPASWPTAPSFPYSYAVTAPLPARGYVGFGSNDFPFYGQPYGHPYERWSWSTFRGDNDLLSRYYYPPVR